MVSALGAGVVLAIVVVHTLVAALLSRLLRVRLSTRWGAAVYTATVVPVVLLLLTLYVSGHLAPNLGGQGAVLFVMIGIPLAIGITIDYVWMPAPDDIELPDVA